MKLDQMREIMERGRLALSKRFIAFHIIDLDAKRDDFKAIAMMSNHFEKLLSVAEAAQKVLRTHLLGTRLEKALKELENEND